MCIKRESKTVTRRTTRLAFVVLFLIKYLFPCVLSSFPGLSFIVSFVLGYFCSPPPPSTLPFSCSEVLPPLIARTTAKQQTGKAVSFFTTPLSINAYFNNFTSVSHASSDPLVLLPSLPTLKKAAGTHTHSPIPLHSMFPSLHVLCVTQCISSHLIVQMLVPPPSLPSSLPPSFPLTSPPPSLDSPLADGSCCRWPPCCCWPGAPPALARPSWSEDVGGRFGLPRCLWRKKEEEREGGKEGERIW